MGFHRFLSCQLSWINERAYLVVGIMTCVGRIQMSLLFQMFDRLPALPSAAKRPYIPWQPGANIGLAHGNYIRDAIHDG